MKRALFVVGVLVLLVGLAVYAARPRTGAPAAPARPIDPGRNHAPVLEQETRAELPPEDPDSDRTNVAPEPVQTSSSNRDGAAPQSVASGDVAVIAVLALDEEQRPLQNIDVHLGFTLPASAPRRTIPPRNARDMMHERRETFSSTSARTGEDGMVQMSVPDASRVSAPAQLTLNGQKRTAERLLQPPLVSQQVTVVMQRCAQVEVSVIDSGGSPVAGAYVDARPIADVGDANRVRTDASAGYRKSDERGIALFDELQSGEYAFSFVDLPSNSTVRETIRAELGKRVFVELRAPSAAQLPEAVAGSVVDETGLPLPRAELRVRVDGGETLPIHSDEHGAFHYLCTAGREVELTAGGGMWDDDFEPSRSVVPFGTRDVHLRRTRKVETIAVEFACTDATSGQPIEGQSLSGTRWRAGRPQEKASFTFPERGRPSLLFRDHADWHVAIGAAGYVRQEFVLADELLRRPEGNQVALRLVRGPNPKRDQ